MKDFKCISIWFIIFTPGIQAQETGQTQQDAIYVGTFASTGGKIYDEVNALAVGIGFRPSATTVLRANFLRHWQRDILGNPTVHTGGFQFGIASYF